MANLTGVLLQNSLSRKGMTLHTVTKALFFLILGLRIFFQNIKVGGGKKTKIKLLKKFFI